MSLILKNFVKTDQLAQCVAENGFPANNATYLTQSQWEVFKYICRRRLQPAMEAIFLQSENFIFLVVLAQHKEVHNRLTIFCFSQHTEIHHKKRKVAFNLELESYLDSWSYTKFCSQDDWEAPINHQTAESAYNNGTAGFLQKVSLSLKNACESALKQPLPGKQPVFMTDARQKFVNFALVTEGNPDHKIQSKLKTYVQIALRPNFFSLLISMCYDLWTFLGFVHGFSWVSGKHQQPTVVVTNKKSVTHLFRTISIPRSLWKACHCALQFKFKRAHIPGPIIEWLNVFLNDDSIFWKSSASTAGNMLRQKKLSW